MSNSKPHDPRVYEAKKEDDIINEHCDKIIKVHSKHSKGGLLSIETGGRDMMSLIYDIHNYQSRLNAAIRVIDALEKQNGKLSRKPIANDLMRVLRKYAKWSQ